MEISEIISLSIALVAVAISLATLRQSRNMVEESTRPNIVAYVTTTNFQSWSTYVVIKNFGQTGAQITRFNTEPDLLTYSYSQNHRPFGKIENSFLAPGQSHICSIDSKLIHENYNVLFEIEYKTKFKTYTESINVNLIGENDNISARASTKDCELEIISFTLQDLVEKQL